MMFLGAVLSGLIVGFLATVWSLDDLRREVRGLRERVQFLEAVRERAHERAMRDLDKPSA